MTKSYVEPDLVRIALERVEGSPFERFANEYYAAIVGHDFVPLGGMSDGGADARDGALFEDGKSASVFYQASVEADYRSKIRRTAKRLREFGRVPSRIVYLTSRPVQHSDRVEEELSAELGVVVTIRDREYFVLHINRDDLTRLAFERHLAHLTNFLKGVGRSSLVEPSAHARSASVYVFLANEVGRRSGAGSLVAAVVDALVLWALEGTDPDKGVLRSEDEILTRIVAELPSVETMVRQNLAARLSALSSKGYSGGRAIKWHRQEDAYCLPFDVRRELEQENLADETLRLRVTEGFRQRLMDLALPETLEEEDCEIAVAVAMRSVQLAFEREGLEFSAYVKNGGSGDYPTIADALREALNQTGVTGPRAQRIGDAGFQILRGVLYSSSEEERDYLHRLSRTYALLFTLNTEPKLLEFFQEMTAEFRLYVGSDQLVRALSEQYLDSADQMTRNTLLMAARAGAKVILTEPVLDEVVSHLRISDLEYREHVAAVEAHMTYEFAREAPQILLRSYLYSRLRQDLGKRQPRNWPAFVEQFCSYGTLHRTTAFSDVRQYLQLTFGLSYESTEDLERLVDLGEVDQLATELATDKKSERLARNDALLALAVYGRRKRSGETQRISEFGWGTWWLTGETAIVRHTRELVSRHGARYIMRPDFLLTFMTLAPSAQAARETYAKVFPSMLGIRLAKRMKREAFDELMDRVEQADQMDEARRSVEMAKLTNALKSDLGRQYTGNSGTSSLDETAARYVGKPGSH